MLDLIKNNLNYEHKFYKATAVVNEKIVKSLRRNFVDENKSTYSIIAPKKVSQRQISRNASGSLLYNSNYNQS